MDIEKARQHADILRGAERDCNGTWIRFSFNQVSFSARVIDELCDALEARQSATTQRSIDLPAVATMEALASVAVVRERHAIARLVLGLVDRIMNRSEDKHESQPTPEAETISERTEP